MTLLVLDVRTPVGEAIRPEQALLRTLAGLAPQMTAYLMSFLTLGIFWVGQQSELSPFARGNHHLTWIHIAFLFPVSLMPFSTRLLAEFMRFRTALVFYWINILLLGVMLFASWRYAKCSACCGKK